ncbi:PREDICTED: gap junction delta-3 protein [Miniopterus natalensis]|uniref:gap junction delta-3 protein n=1 Tax=Miniopterus natalensis TaxID=291302 RepID=UPI0007A6BB2D|nr:PREDICTED: gap junction delta-3 protein [Miniopterus natalensis]
MGEWAFLSSLLDAVQLQSPLVGRLWLVVMLIFRILVLATVGGAVFEDEQEEFVCNTLQPGCRQTCYDRAFPVSHYRFWLFHILLLSAPPVLFVIYSMHQASKEPGVLRRRLESEAGPRRRSPYRRGKKWLLQETRGGVARGPAFRRTCFVRPARGDAEWTEAGPDALSPAERKAVGEGGG